MSDLFLAAALALALPEGALDAECRPALPYFCASIHVRCAGRSALPTFAFRLRAEGATGRIEAAAAPADIVAPYARAQVHWGEDRAYVLLRPEGAAGYVKLGADGRYSFRHYEGAAAVMAYGHCEPLRR